VLEVLLVDDVELVELVEPLLPSVLAVVAVLVDPSKPNEDKVLPSALTKPPGGGPGGGPLGPCVLLALLVEDCVLLSC
jgi:hypothetical protein